MPNTRYFVSNRLAKFLFIFSEETFHVNTYGKVLANDLPRENGSNMLTVFCSHVAYIDVSCFFSHQLAVE